MNLNVGLLSHNIQRARDIMLHSLERNSTILVCGNGGSFADASHFAGELVNSFTRHHHALPILTLGSNNAVLTSWSNDYSFESQFSREFEAFSNPDSTLCVFSTSGNSKNIQCVLQTAKERGIRSIGFTSNRGAVHLDSLCEVLIVAPTDSTPHSQEIHIIAYHALALAIEEAITDQ